jgi:TolB-like protein/Flp pilus assembly protein TadD
MVGEGAEGGADGEPPAVFISYASPDATTANALVEALERHGIRCWIAPRDVKAGALYADAIVRAITGAKAFVLVLSASALASSHVGKEVERASAKQRRIIAVRIDQAALTPAFEYFLSESQWVEATAGHLEPAYPKLVDAIRESGRGAPAALPAGASATAAAPPAAVGAGERRIRWAAMALAAAVLAVLAFAGIRLVTARHGAVEPPPAAAAGTASSQSIAVLPFTDMSEKKDQEYFSDGLADTLLDLLAKTPGLHVIARTSSFSFKGKSDDIPTIATKLHVANILEGSVRRAGTRLRVTTQLIRASDGEHLWSETYDREVADVFKVQDEIAGAVASALKLKLAPQQKSAAQRTSSAAAYNEYLLGRQFYNRFNGEDFRRAAVAYQRAIKLDPGYAAAYAEYSIAQFYVADDTGDPGEFALAAAAAERAVALAPDDGNGYSARGFQRAYYAWDWAGAQADFEKALTLAPDDAVTYDRYGLLLLALRRVPESIATFRKDIELDPLSLGWLHLTRAQLAAHDYDSALGSAHRALEISPDSPRALGFLGLVQLLQRHPAEALATFRRISDGDWLALPGVAMAEFSLGHPAESRRALDAVEARFARTAAVQIAETHAWCGEKNLALDWLDRAYAQRDTGLSLLTHDPLFDPLRGEARFKTLLRKMRLPE